MEMIGIFIAVTCLLINILTNNNVNCEINNEKTEIIKEIKEKFAEQQIAEQQIAEQQARKKAKHRPINSAIVLSRTYRKGEKNAEIQKKK